MPPFSFILAQADGDDVVKILFGIIALIIWGVGAMASAAKKQKEQQRRRQMLDADPFRPPPPRSPPPVVRPVPPMMHPNVPLPPPVRPAPAVRPLPPLPPRVTPAPPRLQAPQVPRVMTPVPPQRRTQPPKKQQPRRAAPAPRRVPTPVPVEALAPMDEDGPSAPSAFANEIRSAEEATAAAAVARKPAVSAMALSRWLTPATLRSQFILTEVLQPPLAMRPDREQ